MIVVFILPFKTKIIVTSVRLKKQNSILRKMPIDIKNPNTIVSKAFTGQVPRGINFSDPAVQRKMALLKYWYTIFMQHRNMDHSSQAIFHLCIFPKSFRTLCIPRYRFRGGCREFIKGFIPWLLLRVDNAGKGRCLQL
jgi:hypothetical protein